MKKLISLFCVCSFLFFSCVSSSVVMKEMYGEYYSIAEQYYTNKNYPKALEYYNKASTSSELANTCTYKMARIYAQTGDFDSSYRLFSSLLDIDPDNASIMSSLAYVYAKKGLYEDAIVLYEKILSKYTYDTTSQKNLIMIYDKMGNKEKARQHAEEYSRKFPYDTQVFSLITEEEKDINAEETEEDPVIIEPSSINP